MDEFTRAFLALLRTIIPSDLIARYAGVEAGDGMVTAMAASHREHLRKEWRPAHEAFTALTPPPERRAAHHRLATASRAYGSAIACFVDLSTWQSQNLMGTAAYLRTRENGREWDRLTSEYVRSLLDELETTAEGRRLLDAADAEGVSLKRLRAIAEGTDDIMADMGFGAVASFV
ncbi:MAG: hypothetical protein FJ318_07000 [SAR202 cluster bacterium]|nr:hypothetical protein [SAR202 cluster bacterium]